MTKQPKSGRRVFACRVAVETPEKVEAIAYALGCYRVNPHAPGELLGAAGVMMDRIAAGELKIVSNKN